jgi:hypothetical protein
MEQSASAEIQEEANALIINVNDNSESQREVNGPTGNESHDRKADREGNLLQDRVLANKITEMLGSLESPLSPECCIYRVPHELRKLNEEAYTPKVISIGPFHCDNKSLQAMEQFKMKYFKRFVQYAAVDVETLVSTIRDMEKAVRRCYAETSKLGSDNYVKMILVDASFIIAFFLYSVSEHGDWSIDDNSTTFTVWLMSRVFNDMWLLENQLPFFVMEELYNLAFSTSSNYPASFTLLTSEFFELYKGHGITFHVPLDDPNLKILHFCDLLRTCFLPPSAMLPERCRMFETRNLHTASQLDETGVEFKEGSSQCFFDLKFEKGELKIPCLNLYASTESLLRNLVALEQCHYVFHAYVTDYVLLLDSLIDTSKDVDILVKKGILNNTLGDSNAVTTLVNKLGQQILLSSTNSNYYKLYEDLNTFYEGRWHRWKATLRRDYLSTPWRTASTVAAIILLVLTLAQTICSIISLPKI